MENKKIPKDWKLVKLGDVVEHIKEKIHDREEWKVNRYIGGQHFDEGEIRITKSAPIEGNELVIGSAFHMKFKPGQVLYVTRNPRLRKGGMVDFEGVCSNVTFTLEAKKDELMQELLPFVIQTENFTRHACASAHGSTNPFLNWKDIANYDLLLPSISEQKKIAEVLWGVEENIKYNEQIIEKFERFKKIFLNNLFNGKTGYKNFIDSELGKIPKTWKIIDLYDVIDKDIPYSFTGGPFGSDLKSKDYTKEGVRIIQLQNIGDGEFKNDYFLHTSQKKADQLKSCNIYPGEIIISKMADPLARACFIPDFDKRYVMCSDGIRIVVDEKRYDKYLILNIINSKYFRDSAIRNSTGTTRMRIGLGELKKLKIKIPSSLEEQKKISKTIRLLEEESENQKRNLKSLKDLRQKLMNELLTGNVRL